MPMYAHTLWMWIVCGVQYICFTIFAISNLFGWWCCDVGCCMWLLLKIMLLRLYVNMCVSSREVCVVLKEMSVALSFVHKMFWWHGNLSHIIVLLLGLDILDPAILPTIWPLEFLVGGMNDPFVYMHYCGWNWGCGCGCIWLARGCESVCGSGSVYYGGVLPCVGEFDIVVCAGRFDGVCVMRGVMGFCTPPLFH